METIDQKRLWMAQAGAVLLVGAGLAVIGPYGTFSQLSLPLRLLYWISIVAINWIQVSVALRLATARLRPPEWPRIILPVIAALAASLPATAEVLLLEHWFRPGSFKATQTSLAELYLLVLVITLPVTLMLQRRRPVAIAEPTKDGAGRFFQRLPAKLGQDLLCLRTEDHYLRVITRAGEDLILLRMADAEAELAGFDGVRVHRSWWVARSAVQKVERDDSGRLTLVLVNGSRVPVSRSMVGVLRTAGWLSGPLTPPR